LKRIEINRSARVQLIVASGRYFISSFYFRSVALRIFPPFFHFYFCQDR